MSAMIQSEHDLEAALQATKRRLRVVSLAIALAVWAAAAVTWLLVFVVCDHWLPHGVPDRLRLLTAGAFLLASAGWLAVAGVLPAVRRINDLYVARLIERTHPELRNSLVDAIQLTQRKDLPGSIRAAVVELAARDVRAVEPQRSVPTRRLRVAAQINAAALALFAVYTLVAPKPVMPSIKRALGLPLTAPTFTRIVGVMPEDATSILQGEPVTFTARMEGKRPNSASVRFSLDGGTNWLTGQQLAMTPPDGGGAAGTSPWQATKAAQDVQQSMHWQILAGDAQTPLRRLDVRPVPQITAMSLSCQYPAYTRLPPTTQPGGEVDAVVGTQVTVETTTNVPVYAPLLIMGQPPDEKRRLLPLPPSTQPQRLTARFTVLGDDTYRIAFRDTHGEPNHDPIRYAIHGRPDEPPVVRLEPPLPPGEMSPDDILALSAGIMDDYGISRAALLYRRPGQGQRAARELTIPLPLRDAGRAVQVAESIPLARLEAKPGDVIEWWVGAWDNRENAAGQPEYQQGNSDVQRLVIRAPKMLAQKPPSDSQESKESEPGAGTAKKDKGSTAGQRQSRSPASQALAKADGTNTDGKDQAPTATEPAQETTPEESMASAQGDVAQANPDESGTKEPSTNPASQQDERRPSDEFALAHERELNTLAKYLLGKASEQPGATGDANDGAKGSSQTNDRSKNPTQDQASNGSTPETNGKTAGQPGNEQRAGQETNGQKASESQARAQGTEQGSNGQRPEPSATGSKQAAGEKEPDNRGEKPAQQAGQEPAPAQATGMNEPGQDKADKASTSGTDEPKAQPASTGQDSPEHRDQSQSRPAEAEPSTPQPTDTQSSEEHAGNIQQQDANAPCNKSGPEASGQAGDGQKPAEGTGNSQQGTTQEPSSKNGHESSAQAGEGQGSGPGSGKGQQGTGQEPSGKSKQESSGQAGEGQGSGKAGQGQEPSQGKSEGQSGSSGTGQGSGQSTGTQAQDGKSSQSGQESTSEGLGQPTKEQADQAGSSNMSVGGGAPRSSDGPGDAPLPETRPSDAPINPVEMPESATDRIVTTDRVGDIIDALNRSLRRGELDENMLSELDWDLPDARQFVKDYERAKGQGQRQVGRSELPTQTIESEAQQLGDEKVLRADKVATTDVRLLKTTDQQPADATRQLLEVGRQRVLPRYQPLLEAYYRSLASQPATSPFR